MQLAPLRVSGRVLRQRLVEDEPGDLGPRRTELGFFSGGGAWAVLGALVVSVASLPAALTWPTIGGGGLAPLATTTARLWAEATGAQRSVGWDTIGPADPFSAVVAVLGSLSFGDPSRALVVLWLLALPLAVLGAWFAATRITERPALRIAAGVLWALAPTFLIALGDGRPAAVIVHLTLPWVVFTAAAAHRSWGNAGTASILLAVVVACAPVLAAPVVAVWALAFVVALVRRGRRAAFRWVWIIVPTVAASAPLVVARLVAGDPWALLADPGRVWAGPRASTDPLGRLLVAAGFPADAGWGAFASAEGPVWWLALFTLPLILLALAAAASPRRFVGIALLAIAGLGILTAFVAAGIAVSVAQTTPVALWPGTAVSVAWIGIIGGAVLTLDTIATPRLARALAASLAVAGIVVAAVPALTAQVRDAAIVGRGEISTLPAFIAAEGAGSPGLGTIVLTPANGGLGAEIVWGGSATLGGQSTLVSARAELSDADRELAQVAADLASDSATDVVAQLTAHGIGFVLVAPAPADETAQARTTRLAAETALDGRDGLDVVGVTEKGELWRVSAGVTPRADASAGAVATTRAAWTAIGIVFAVALLLSLPTRGSRSAARAVPRVVGTRPTRKPIR